MGSESALFRDLLRRSRRARGLSQTDLARELGLPSAQLVSNWERGYGPRIPISALKKLIQFFKIPQTLAFEAYLQDERERMQRRLMAEFKKLKDVEPD